MSPKHGAAPSRRGKETRSPKKESPKKSTHKDREEIAVGSKPSEIDELKALFGRQERPPAEVEPVPETRELPQAGTALNADIRLALTALDDRLVNALKAGYIRFVRSSWLLAQPDDYRIAKRQDLEVIEQSGISPSPLLTYKEAATLIRKGDRSAGILSYGCALCNLCNLFQPTLWPHLAAALAVNHLL